MIFLESTWMKWKGKIYYSPAHKYPSAEKHFFGTTLYRYGCDMCAVCTTKSLCNHKVNEIMLRSSFLPSPTFNCKHYNLVRLTFGKLNTGVALRSLSTSCSPARLHQRWSSRSLLPLLSSRSIVCFGRPINSSTLRLLSTSGSNTNKKSDQTDAKKSTSTSKDGDGKQESSDSNEIVLTPGETVVAVSRLTMWAGIAVFATACAYYIAMELIPT